MEPQVQAYPLQHDDSLDAKFYEPDKSASKLFPQDTPKLVPIAVGGDGNCLPRSASLLAFGNQNQHEELRARIVVELAAHEEFYLESKNLGADLQGLGPTDLAKNYCQHSPHCQTSQLDAESVRSIFRQEVCSVAKKGVWMSIWEVHAIASILGKRLMSIYPQLTSIYPNLSKDSESSVRSELHRTLLPRESSSSPEAVPLPAIMWTRMGGLRPGEIWATDHFVPCLPLSQSETGSQPQTEQHPLMQARWHQAPEKHAKKRTSSKKSDPSSIPSSSKGVDIRGFFQKKL